MPSKEPTRQERIRRLKKLREAATTLHALLTSFDALWWDLPLGLLDPNDLDASGVDEDLDASAGGRTRFVASLKLLADTAAGRIEELTAEQARKGRPAKNAPFRELTPRLVRQYERFTKQPAGPPNWIPNSGIWRGKGSFYPFARAVWCCLRDNLPAEARAAIPSTEEGLAQELKKHWPKGGASR